MKIKKKRYKKELDDAYWRGVDAGIRFALEKPDLAESFNVEQIRAITSKLQKVFASIGESLTKAFKGDGII